MAGLMGSGSALAIEFRVHASFVGDYSAKIGPTLEESTGLMIEIAAAAFKRANLPVKMAPEVPWARAQQEAMDEPGGILVVLARTPGREILWKWVSTVYTDKVYAYTMQGWPIYSSYEEIRDKKPRVGTKLASASESLLKGMGVPVEATPDMDKGFMKLMSGRIDVFLLQGMEVYPALQPILQGKYRDEFLPKIQDLRRTPLMDLPLWMAVSPKTPDAEVQKLRDAMENFKRSPEYRVIVKKYESRQLQLEQH